jgi:hypothetical protein
MFVGHYGVSFAAKRVEPSIPLWVLFVAVQWLDVLWAPLVLLGIEKVRIVPGFTASNPFDLYYMPYTHSLVAALLWSGAAMLAYRAVAGPSGRQGGVVVGLAVFSHWVLDLVVHRADLPLYDDSAKVGLGLWNVPAVAFALEAALLFGGLWLCLRGKPARSFRTLTFGVLMLGVQAYVFFGPPPTSDRAFAWTALVLYAVFALVIWWLQDRRPIARARS